MTQPLILSIGEVLWDVLPEGKKLGGAPCNFAYHVGRLGARALPFSAIGDDDNGREILELLSKKGLPTDLIEVVTMPTSTVSIELDENGVPSYIIHENVAWDAMSLTQNAINVSQNADVICFGSLAQRSAQSHETIMHLVKNAKSDSLVVFDINLRQHYYSKAIIEKSLSLSNVLKLNEEELPVIATLLNLKTEAEEVQLRELITKYNLKLIAYTKGAESSMLLTPTDASCLPTPKVEIKDTVGAGDSFTAAMVMGFLANEPLKEIHQNAINLAAFVCTQDGAMPNY